MRLRRRRRCSGARRALLPLLLLAWVPAPLAASATILHELSFTNGPEILSPQLRRGRTDLWLRFDARFANDCLADAGVEATWLDRPEARARLLWLVPRTPPEGCPELFRPVTRPLWIRLTGSPAPPRLILLDAGYRAEGLGALQAAELRAEAAEAIGGEPPAEQVVRASDLRESAYVPTLAAWQAEPEGAARGSLRALRITFEALIPRSCADRELATTIRESRTGVSDAENAPVLDWLIATLPDARDCRGEPIERRRIFLRREVAAGYRRRAILLNPVAPRPAEEDAVFTVIDVFR